MARSYLAKAGVQIRRERSRRLRPTAEAKPASLVLPDPEPRM